MDRSAIEALDVAARALNDRELEPFVGLMADDMVWRAQAPRWFWWRDAPSWRGPEEARASLEHLKGLAEELGVTGSARLLPGRNDRAVLELREEAPKSSWGTNIVITMAGSKIVAMDEQRRAGKARRLAQVGWVQAARVEADVTAPFDLRALYRAIDAERERRSLAWVALARETGVAASTMRRFEHASDAEADGVLAAIAWLGSAPEDYVAGDAADAVLLPSAKDRYVRVDMELVAVANCGPGGAQGRTRTSIQKLVAIAQSSGRPVASLTRLSEV